MVLTVNVKISAAELEKAVRFLYNDDLVVQQVIDAYFSGAGPMMIDISEIKDTEIRSYHRNGLIAVLINLINAENK